MPYDNLLLRRRFFLHLAAMTLERARGSELAQAMADHIFRHEHLHVDLAVVDHERQSHKLGHDRAGPGPRLDRLFRAHLLRGLDLLENLEVHKGTFFARTTHRLLSTAVSVVRTGATCGGERSPCSTPSPA